MISKVIFSFCLFSVPIWTQEEVCGNPQRSARKAGRGWGCFWSCPCFIPPGIAVPDRKQFDWGSQQVWVLHVRVSPGENVYHLFSQLFISSLQIHNPVKKLAYFDTDAMRQGKFKITIVWEGVSSSSNRKQIFFLLCMFFWQWNMKKKEVFVRFRHLNMECAFFFWLLKTYTMFKWHLVPMFPVRNIPILTTWSHCLKNYSLSCRTCQEAPEPGATSARKTATVMTW